MKKSYINIGIRFEDTYNHNKEIWETNWRFFRITSYNFDTTTGFIWLYLPKESAENSETIKVIAYRISDIISLEIDTVATAIPDGCEDMFY